MALTGDLLRQMNNIIGMPDGFRLGDYLNTLFGVGNAPIMEQIVSNGTAQFTLQRVPVGDALVLTPSLGPARILNMVGLVATLNVAPDAGDVVLFYYN